MIEDINVGDILYKEGDQESYHVKKKSKKKILVSSDRFWGRRIWFYPSEFERKAVLSRTPEEVRKLIDDAMNRH